MRNKILSILMISILLAGCGSIGGFTPKSTVRVVTTTSYPEFPDMEPLAPIRLFAWETNVPRDITKVVPKNTSICLKVPEEKRDRLYWNRCGENPILPDSNIFIGFDQTNWNIIVENFARLRERLIQYKARMKEINFQRQQWREKAQRERERLQKLETEAIKQAR